jgi:hypothetical protein
MRDPLPQSKNKPRINQTLAGGVALVALAGLALVLALPLDFGSMAEIGPGFLPVVVSMLIGLIGLVIIAVGWHEQQSAHASAEVLQAWAWRPIMAVLGAVITFGLLIRGMPLGPVAIPALGLSIAVPACLIVAGLADPETRWRELAILGLILTGGAIVLFRFVLRLSIPVAPWLIGY